MLNLRVGLDTIKQTFLRGQTNLKEGEQKVANKTEEEKSELERRAKVLTECIANMDQQIKQIQIDKAKQSKELRSVTQKLVTISLREKGV